MKNKILNMFLAVLILTGFTFAQNTMMRVAAKETQSFDKARPVHAGEYLQRFYEKTGFNPDNVVPQTTSLKKPAFNFQVGTQVSWKAANFLESKYYDVPSTCRAVGTHCYIFVEDAIWGSSVSQTGIDAVKNAFDNSTPIDPNKGIYTINTEVFGNPPDIDGDPKIVLLILDIKDDYDGQPGSGYIAGYFSSGNQLPKTQNANSNVAEIYYLDGAQNNLTIEDGINDAMSTTAHEFQHMIHYNYFEAIGKNPITFYNEMCSLSAEFINGYPLYSQSRYTNESNQWLELWRDDNDVLTDYSRAAKLGRYLYEQFGTALFTQFLAGGTSGISGLNKALTAMGSSRRMADILPDWFMANILNDRTINDKWGYVYTPLSLMAQRNHNNPNTSYSGVLNNLAVEYVTFTNGKNLTFNYNNSSNSKLKAVAVKYGSSVTTEEVAANTNYNLSEFGNSISKVTFVLYNVDTSPLAGENGKSNFSYTATGEFGASVQELAYDDTEPVGFINLDVGDSIAVQFPAMPGFRLDSIRVAIRNLNPINGRVLEYLGYTTKLGGTLYANFTATSELSVAPVADGTQEYPYPKPYPNWTTVDLRSFNISVEKDFVVEFPYESPYPDSKNRLLATYKPSTGEEHTITYRASTAKWGYTGVAGKENYSWVGLIRAYISLVTDVNEVVELLPTAYTLEQNYPNPFNPSTIISYNLPKAGNVQIKIFDALGREVRSLINEEKSAGKYNIAWNARDNYGGKISSGVYFYTINSGDFVQTKKMVLMK